MKTVEEKAKAYDEALQRTRKWYDSNTNEGFRGIFEDIFPQLKVSEDEKIKKRIIALVNAHGQCMYKEGMLAWLEKQGKNNMGISEATKQKLEDNLNKALEKETPESWNKFLDEQGEQKPTWSEEDETIINKILAICNDFERSFEASPLSTKVIKEDVDKIDNWLKSLKERYTWKPSDEQMENLSRAFNGGTFQTSLLMELYQELKKLRGE